VHGDLRSPNLFVGADGKIKIGDFGFCRILRPDAEQVKVTQGTHPRWVAPEVMRSNELRKASDVYSYGMVRRGGGVWFVWVGVVAQKAFLFLVPSPGPLVRRQHRIPPSHRQNTPPIMKPYI
jgi:serine/threonine protein kinase